MSDLNERALYQVQKRSPQYPYAKAQSQENRTRATGSGKERDDNGSR